jgi:hypothetical protein
MLGHLMSRSSSFFFLHLDPESTADLQAVLLHCLGLGIKDVLEQHPVRLDAQETLAQRDEAREMCNAIQGEVVELGKEIIQQVTEEWVDR